MSTTIAQTLVPAGRLSYMFGQRMLTDVKPADFARLAPGKDGPVLSNHPAWVYGHLALYAPRVLEMVGYPEAESYKLPHFADLFKAGTDCCDDPACGKYPKMDEIVNAWSRGYEKALEVLPSIGDDVFARPNPAEGRMKDMFPTVGAMTGFMMAAHPMSHYGQISAWRRFMGMPAVSLG